jgi:hypothetical protein
MSGSSPGTHEDTAKLRPETLDRHRALVSLMEELEAVDGYDQRIDAATDDELRRVLEHNRDEEKEHAAMVLEWLRRRDPRLGGELAAYLFTGGDITDETGDDDGEPDRDAADATRPPDSDPRPASAA